MDEYDHTNFDHAHYYKIRKERRRTGLPVLPLQEDIKDHPFLNKIVCWNNKQYFVERVFKEWCVGWYISALIKNIVTNSHVCVPIENINSTIKTNFIDLKLVD